MQYLKIAQVIILNDKCCPVLGDADNFIFPYFIGIASRQNFNSLAHQTLLLGATR